MKQNIKYLVLGFIFLMSFNLSAQSKIKIYEHEVKAKETLWSLSKRYNTTVESIKLLNPWLSVESLKVGDKLIIRLNSKLAEETKKLTIDKEDREHVIKKGETLYAISRAYGVTVAQILQANEGLSLEHYTYGEKIIIPNVPRKIAEEQNKESSEVKGSKLVQEAVLELSHSIKDLKDIRFVDVLIMLPFERSPYFVEYYEGFLMGLNDLKKKGFSVRLQAEIVPDLQALKVLLNKGICKGKELIIAGTTNEEVELLAQTELDDDAFLLSPFVYVPDEELSGDRIIQVNAGKQMLEERAVHRFIEMYQNRNILFASKEASPELSFVTLLKKRLLEQEIPFDEYPMESASSIPLKFKTIVVPTSDSRLFAEELFGALPNLQQYEVFGFPKWQSFGLDFAEKMHRHNTTIYSSFFLNPQMVETRDFLVKYVAWYDKKVGASYPKYSLLGYDVARYFVQAYALYQENFPSFAYSLPYDGLQMDIDLLKARHGYVNRRYYWISFLPDGRINRQSLW